MAEGSSQRISLTKLLAKWTGISFIRRKYRLWRAKRVVVAADDVSKIRATKDGERLPGGGLVYFDSFSTGSNEETLMSVTTGVEALGLAGRSPSRITNKEILQLVLSADSELYHRALSDESCGNYIFQRILGTGSFSKVKLAIDSRTGEKVAIKMIDAKEVRNTPRLQRTLFREVEILGGLRHPNVIQFREVTFIRDTICLVMNYVSGVELFQYVAERKRLGEFETSQILRQVLLAVDYLHQHGIVHRDLKLENILVEQRGGEGPKVTLIDFGLARLLRSNALMTTRCGSEEYAAPEVIIGHPYDGRASDAWSFGVVMYACLFGSLPFNPETGRPRALAEKIVSATFVFPDNVHTTSLTAVQIIKGLLIRVPDQRLTISELLTHPWFNQTL